MLCGLQSGLISDSVEAKRSLDFRLKRDAEYKV